MTTPREAFAVYQGEVHDLCILAGRPDVADGFIGDRKPVARVRSELLEAQRAQASLADRMRQEHGRVASAEAATPPPAVGSLARRMRETHPSDEGRQAAHDRPPARASLSDRMRAQFGRREP